MSEARPYQDVRFVDVEPKEAIFISAGALNMGTT